MINQQQSRPGFSEPYFRFQTGSKSNHFSEAIEVFKPAKICLEKVQIQAGSLSLVNPIGLFSNHFIENLRNLAAI